MLTDEGSPWNLNPRSSPHDKFSDSVGAPPTGFRSKASLIGVPGEFPQFGVQHREQLVGDAAGAGWIGGRHGFSPSKSSAWGGFGIDANARRN